MKNEKGIAHLLILMLVVSAMIVGGGIGYVMKQNNADRARQQNQDKLDTAVKLSNQASLETKAEAELAEQLKAEAAETKPAPKPVSKPSSSTTKTAPKTPEGTVSISDDGCTVTVSGKTGMAVKIGAYSDKKGGESDFTVPDSGTLSERSGGIKGMFAYGKLYNSAGEKVAYASKTITAENCF